MLSSNFEKLELFLKLYDNIYLEKYKAYNTDADTFVIRQCYLEIPHRNLIN